MIIKNVCNEIKFIKMINNFEIKFKKKLQLINLSTIKKFKKYKIFEIFMIRKNYNKKHYIFQFKLLFFKNFNNN